MFQTNLERTSNFLKTDFFYSGGFLQSVLWRDFLDKQEKRNWQVSITNEKNEVYLSCLLYENKLPLGKSYLYAPKGPVFKNNLTAEEKKELLSLFFSKVRDLIINTQRTEEIFLEIEPSEELIDFKQLKNVNNIQPQTTSFLILDKEPKAILAKMHPKTRYNIMLANKKGVTIKILDQKADIEIFLELNKKTATRQNINTHPDNYYRLLWQSLLEKNAGKLFVAYYKDVAIAANLVIFWEKTATYLHGASNYDYRQVMAPYLLQWEAIKFAKEQGFSFYDFWGIAPQDGSKPSWDGFTRFKKGFKGEEFYSAQAKALVYNQSWYQAYLVSKKFLKLIKF